jgi:phosphohistidine swiveling domain-containing protein
MTGYTVRLGDSTQTWLTGGKGANLGALITAGLPVPEGFVVTTAAYRDFIDDAGLAEAGPERLRELIPRSEIPDRIAGPIRAAYAHLGSPPVAVRSSGTAEDLATASFAGQHDTFLNIAGADAVLIAVRNCWASLWTPRAVAYRQQHCWDERGLALAVVIQRMIDADWAGVMFTADPVSGRRDRIVVEAVRGLGEALVSGEASGRQCVIDKATHKPVSGEPAIPGLALTELVTLGLEAEQLFGAPQDIEWTYCDGHCALVQARPITALPDEPVDTPSKPERTRKPRVDFSVTADHMPYPPFPMDVSLVFRPLLRAVLDGIRAAGFAVPSLQEVLVEIEDGVVQIVPPRVRPTWRVVLGVPAVVPKVLRLAGTKTTTWRARSDETLVRLATCLDAANLSGLDDQELLGRAREMIRTVGALMPSRFGIVMRGTMTEQIAKLLLGWAVGRRRADGLLIDLMADIPCVTTAANADLERIAATVRSTPELREVYLAEEPADIAGRLRGSAPGRALLGEVDAHLSRYGFREMSIITVGLPPLRDAPWIVHGIIKGLARLEENPDRKASDRLAHGRSELASERGLRARLLRRVIVRPLDSARACTGFREDSYYLIVMSLAVTRRVLLEFGRRLVERGILANADDIAYLELDELGALSPSGPRQIVERRRTARAASLDHYTAVPAEFLGPHDGDDRVHGAPASRGKFVGPVRVIHDETEFATLEAGEVLVCPYTNPIWTPLFSVAGAVVVDSGGVASHAAIVARERGIPAIMGTANGTRVLTDGQRVLVDADRGIVAPIGGGDITNTPV